MKISFWTGWSVTGRTYAKKWRRRIAVGTVNSRETILPRRKKIFLLSFSFLSFRTRSLPLPIFLFLDHDFRCASKTSPLFLPFVPTQRGWMYLKIFSPSSVPFPGGVPSAASREKLSLCLRFAFSNNSAKIFGRNPRRINRMGGRPSLTLNRGVRIVSVPALLESVQKLTINLAESIVAPFSFRLIEIPGGRGNLWGTQNVQSLAKIFASRRKI